jgi:hypothetical protein
MRGSILQMDIDDVRRIGLHETLTWIVEETAHLCEAIHDEFLDPPLDMLRARVVRDGSQAAARSRSQAGFSA